eukprot:TRINITY_DN514_c0_g2_i1.p1 TRINITY_DN514_c0_g2~~TRINITY_DN514_c0_g2_i1.p1  ORF type:complete len:387 (-),score=82.21 TRINITY_DN514_c0_g2_i1:100-1260(-)
MSGGSGGCSWGEMPADVRRRVVEMLDPAALDACARVSRGFRQLAMDDSVWRALCKSRFRVLYRSEPSWHMAFLRWSRNDMFDRGRALLQAMAGYQGHGAEVSKGYKDAADVDKATWEAISQSISDLYTAYQFGQELAVKCSRDILPSVLYGDEGVRLAWRIHDLAEVVQFCLQFDYVKMTTPDIQNDLAYYHRKVTQGGADATFPVNDVNTNKMTWFFANPDPMCRILSELISAEAKKPTQAATAERLALIANSYLCVAARDPVALRAVQHRLPCIIWCPRSVALHAMTGFILLHEFISKTNPYASKACALEVGECIAELRCSPGEDERRLLDHLRFQSTFLNVTRPHGGTPASIWQLLLADEKKPPPPSPAQVHDAAAQAPLPLR